MEFELDVTDAPPTSDQLKNILEYLGGPSAVSKVIKGAQNESDAMKKLEADGEAFERPVVSLPGISTPATANSGRWWTGTKAKQVREFLIPCSDASTFLTEAVVGDNESEILSLLRSIPKETDKA